MNQYLVGNNLDIVKDIKCDLVYIDPPYTKYNLTKLLENLSNKIKDTTLIGLETSERDDIVIPENLNLLQKKTYGKTIIYFLKLS